MSSGVFITGMGIVSAIGHNVPVFLESLTSQKTGVDPIRFLDTVHRSDLIAAEVKLSNAELGALSNVSEPELEPRSTLLALLAAREAWDQAGLDKLQHDGLRTGIVSATTVGGMDKTEKDYFNHEKGHPYNHFIFTHECNDSTEKIADSLGVRGYLSTISTACSSSANAIMHGARLIEHGLVDRVIAGGTDALSKFTLNGFNTLMILDKELCKPFDKNRQGLNLGEGAAYLVLESEKAMGSRKPLCRIAGFANANDAYHQTASSPEGIGPFLAMSGAIESAGIEASQIDYINAHGTGTDNNDLTEGIAIEKIFGQTPPPVSSTKPYTGHTLGAAGAVEAVIAILAIQNEILLPNLNFKEKMDELHFDPIREMQTGKALRYVLSNSFGFGGNGTSLIFSKA